MPSRQLPPIESGTSDAPHSAIARSGRIRSSSQRTTSSPSLWPLRAGTPARSQSSRISGQKSRSPPPSTPMKATTRSPRSSRRSSTLTARYVPPIKRILGPLRAIDGLVRAIRVPCDSARQPRTHERKSPPPGVLIPALAVRIRTARRPSPPPGATVRPVSLTHRPEPHPRRSRRPRPDRRRRAHLRAEHVRDPHPGHRRDHRAGRAPARSPARRSCASRSTARPTPRRWPRSTRARRAAGRRPAGALPARAAGRAARREAALQPRAPAPPRARQERSATRSRGSRTSRASAGCALRVGVNCGSVAPEYDERIPGRLDRRDRRLRGRPLRDARRASASTTSSSRSRTPIPPRWSRRTSASRPQRPDVPLHLGVTEAGLLPSGEIKTRIAFEQLLAQGHRRHDPRLAHPAERPQARRGRGRARAS